MRKDVQDDFLYESGVRYDLMYPISTDLPFWLDRAQQFDGPVLEMACGTGRISIPLAQAGYKVTGIDLSAGMLAAAREKAERAAANVTWVHGDVRDFDLEQQFSLIIFPANALCHLLTLDDFERMAACVVRHLRKSGRFILSVFVPSFEILGRDPIDGGYLFAEYVRPEDAKLVQIWYRNQYRADTQINYIELFLKEPNGTEHPAGELSMRMYFPQELDALLKYNGLAVECKYGAHENVPFGPASTQQVPVCTVI